jgi:hypothetical protein
MTLRFVIFFHFSFFGVIQILYPKLQVNRVNPGWLKYFLNSFFFILSFHHLVFLRINLYFLFNLFYASLSQFFSHSSFNICFM